MTAAIGMPENAGFVENLLQQPINFQSIGAGHTAV